MLFSFHLGTFPSFSLAGDWGDLTPRLFGESFPMAFAGSIASETCIMIFRESFDYPTARVTELLPFPDERSWAIEVAGIISFSLPTQALAFLKLMVPIAVNSSWTCCRV
jgi:hypothetical protein